MSLSSHFPLLSLVLKDLFRSNLKISNDLLRLPVEFEHTFLWFLLQVTPNLYGNLVANVAAGIAGGTGVMPGGRVLTMIYESYTCK